MVGPRSAGNYLSTLASGGLAAEKEGTPAQTSSETGQGWDPQRRWLSRESPDSTAVLVPTLSSLYTMGTLLGDMRLLHTITDR